MRWHFPWIVNSNHAIDALTSGSLFNWVPRGLSAQVSVKLRTMVCCWTVETVPQTGTMTFNPTGAGGWEKTEHSLNRSLLNQLTENTFKFRCFEQSSILIGYPPRFLFLLFTQFSFCVRKKKNSEPQNKITKKKETLVFFPPPWQQVKCEEIPPS